MAVGPSLHFFFFVYLLSYTRSLSQTNSQSKIWISRTNASLYGSSAISLFSHSKLILTPSCIQHKLWLSFPIPKRNHSYGKSLLSSSRLLLKCIEVAEVWKKYVKFHHGDFYFLVYRFGKTDEYNFPKYPLCKWPRYGNVFFFGYILWQQLFIVYWNMGPQRDVLNPSTHSLSFLILTLMVFSRFIVFLLFFLWSVLYQYICSMFFITSRGNDNASWLH